MTSNFPLDVGKERYTLWNSSLMHCCKNPILWLDTNKQIVICFDTFTLDQA